MKFKMGDRVAVYLQEIRDVGWVDEVMADGMLAIRHDKSFIQSYVAHPKQCRLLKKKERMCAWLAITPSGKVLQVVVGNKPIMLPPCSNQDLPTWIEFIEVKKK